MINGELEAGQAIVVPTGDANIIRAMQHFLDLAKSGKIVGWAMVGLGPNGETYATQALPPNPIALHIAMGALSSLGMEVNDLLRQFRQPQSASPIIKPNGLHR
jgi:hypothetical protein